MENTISNHAYERISVMSYRSKHNLFIVALFLMLFTLLSSCSINSGSSSNQHTGTPSSNRHTATPGNLTPQPQEVVLSRCQESVSSAVITGIRSPTQKSIYFGGASSNLYALNAQTGKLRWCVHMSQPPLPCAKKPCRPLFPLQEPLRVGTPAVLDGVVYVCASNAPGYTFAFNARDGSLLWRTKTDCWIVDIPFNDNATPLVNNGVVYSGTYALRAQDGHILWRAPTTVSSVGEFILLALVDGVLYGETEGGVYAMNAQNGAILWHYPPKLNMGVDGPLVVSNQMLIIGTQGSEEQPETSALYAINTTNGSLRWYYLMGDYVGAALLNNMAYVASRDQHLYAFNCRNGSILWRYTFNAPVTISHPTITPDGMLYINVDGPYAIDSTNGSVLWHEPLGSNQSVFFTPSVVIDGVDYLVRRGGGQVEDTLYALDASTGTEYWHISNFNQISPLTVA
jgi:outer membrane protein assembly factor BamB